MEIGIEINDNSRDLAECAEWIKSQLSLDVGCWLLCAINDDGRLINDI